MEKRSNETPTQRGIGGPNQENFKSGRTGEEGKGSGFEYFREARLFLSETRATLTFFSDLEVASIHYDMERDEIFYKGHNVKNMTLVETQIEALQKFFDFLSQASQAEELRQAYRKCLDRLLAQRIK